MTQFLHWSLLAVLVILGNVGSEYVDTESSPGFLGVVGNFLAQGRETVKKAANTNLNVQVSFPSSVGGIFRNIRDFFTSLKDSGVNRMLFVAYINGVVFVVTYVSFFAFQSLEHRRQHAKHRGMKKIARSGRRNISVIQNQQDPSPISDAEILRDDDTVGLNRTDTATEDVIQLNGINRRMLTDLYNDPEFMDLYSIESQKAPMGLKTTAQGCATMIPKDNDNSTQRSSTENAKEINGLTLSTERSLNATGLGERYVTALESLSTSDVNTYSELVQDALVRRKQLMDGKERSKEDQQAQFYLSSGSSNSVACSAYSSLKDLNKDELPGPSDPTNAFL